MDFYLSYNNNERILTFPAVPEDIALSRKQENVSFEGYNGQMQAIGTLGLATFTVNSIFPVCKDYRWQRPGSHRDGWYYVYSIEAVRERRIPFRAILKDNKGRTVFNLPVTVDSFEYSVDRAGDIQYSMECTEYRFASVEEDELTAAAYSGTAEDSTAAVVVETAAQAEQSAQQGYTALYTKSEVEVIAKIMFCESRGVRSKTEIACIAWTITNRVDAGRGSLLKVALQPYQFAYRAGAPTVSDYGYDLKALAEDVLIRWSKEKSGQTNVGRVLPKNYQWYAGDGSHNYFYPAYPCMKAQRWTYALPSPYGS